MPIKQVFESQDAIPEFLQSAVVEQDGKWIFEAETAQEVQTLKSTLKKERDGRAQLQKAVQGTERFKPILDALGDADDGEITGFLEAYRNRQNNPAPDPKAQPAPDAVKQLELKDKLHAKALKEREDKLAQIQAEYEKTQRELTEFQLWTPLREMFIKAGGNPEDWELARLDLAAKKQFGFDEDKKIVVLEDGLPSSVSPEKFFREAYSDLRPKFYKASAAGGSGAPITSSGGRGGKTMSRATFEAMSQSERMRASKDGVTFVD